MDNSKLDRYLEECKACLATNAASYEHAENALKQYGQTIASIGYVGFLAVWSQLWGKEGFSDWWLAASGGLILISASLFVGLEVVMMRSNYKVIADKKVLFSELAEAIKIKDVERIDSIIKKIYHKKKDVEGVTLPEFLGDMSMVTGFGAAIILLIGICCALF